MPIWLAIFFAAASLALAVLGFWAGRQNRREDKYDAARIRAEQLVFTVIETSQARMIVLDDTVDQQIAEYDRAQPSSWIVTITNRSDRTFRDVNVGCFRSGGAYKSGFGYRPALVAGATWDVEVPTTTRLESTFTDDDGIQWERADLATDSTLTRLPSVRVLLLPRLERLGRRIAVWRR